MELWTNRLQLHLAQPTVTSLKKPLAKLKVTHNCPTAPSLAASAAKSCASSCAENVGDCCNYTGSVHCSICLFGKLVQMLHLPAWNWRPTGVSSPSIFSSLSALQKFYQCLCAILQTKSNSNNVCALLLPTTQLTPNCALRRFIWASLGQSDQIKSAPFPFFPAIKVKAMPQSATLFVRELP